MSPWARWGRLFPRLAPATVRVLGQTLKTEVGTADFGRSTAQEAQEARPFGTNVANPLAHCP